MRRVRKWHRIVGLILLLPFLGWVITGFIFFIKPGYQAAYAPLSVRTYPLASGEGAALPLTDGAEEIRVLKSILGTHLLIQRGATWANHRADTGALWPEPASADVERLVADAITQNPARYGQVASTDRLQITTTTGIRIVLDWKRMRLSQRGADTDRIDAFYRVHYMQWTGIKWVDSVVGALALFGVAFLALLGLRLALRSR